MSSGAVQRLKAGGSSDVMFPGDAPGRLAVNSATNKLYVASTDKTMEKNSLAVIDETTQKSMLIPFDSIIDSIAVNEQANKIYVSTQEHVTVVDGSTNTATVVPGSTGAGNIVVNAGTNKAYAISGSSAQVMDASGSISSTVSVGDGLILGAAVNPTKNKIYVTTKTTSGFSIKVIDGASDTVSTTMPWDGPLETWALNPATDKLYIGAAAASTAGAVRVVDGATMTETARTSLATAAAYAALRCASWSAPSRAQLVAALLFAVHAVSAPV